MNSNKGKFNHLRDQARLTNEELATALCVSYATICAYASTTNRRSPSAAFLNKLEALIVDRPITKLEGMGYQVVKKAA
ncbi:hypothetical protein [Pseudorhizobium flavum]|uniref:hypothetical protein n=1 Tax=Pseudorhizobium flavum TaxID=1335061 RepID=UPI0037704F9F